MKISKLRNTIKEMIVAELSEDVAYKVSGTKGTSTQSFPNDNAAREFDTKNSNVTLSKLEEKTSDPVVTQLTDIEKQIKAFNAEMTTTGTGASPYKFAN